MSADRNRLIKELSDVVIADAADLFWWKIAEQFPNIKTGDLAPDVSERLRDAMREAVEAWIVMNVSSAHIKKAASQRKLS